MLEKEPLEENLWGAVNGLALLSTGRPEYLPKVRGLARKLGPKTLKLEYSGLGAWEAGYRNIFLCEYYLLTGDEEVKPAIREITINTARGQGMYGTFGHGFAELTPDGKIHGSIPPYGPVNAAGLAANLGIVMGKKCGIDDPEVDAAIERASKFFGYYVDKGAIPYGEHEPWPYHENNGKNSLTAVFFAVQGDRTRETQFFAKMCTAAYKNREYGHTGQGFSYLWSTLGANTGGPEATAAFVKECSWHLDLSRRCDGSFNYDGDEQYGGGKPEDDTYYGKTSYCGLSPTACYVLAYSLPLKKLFITGRDANPKNVAEQEGSSGRDRLRPLRPRSQDQERGATRGGIQRLVAGRPRLGGRRAGQASRGENDGAQTHRHGRRQRCACRSGGLRNSRLPQEPASHTGIGSLAFSRRPLAALQGGRSHQKDGR